MSLQLFLPKEGLTGCEKMKLKAQEGKVLLPADVYVAEISKFTEARKGKPKDDGSVPEFFDIIWTITEGQFKGKTINESYLAYLSPGSKLGKTFLDLTGVMPAPGLEVDLDKLIGVRAKIVVKQKQKQGKTGPYTVNEIESKLKAL